MERQLLDTKHQVENIGKIIIHKHKYIRKEANRDKIIDYYKL